MGCKRPSLLDPALHDKSRVHPRNFHNLHLNICLEHHGMEAKEEMRFFYFVPPKDWKWKTLSIIHHSSFDRSIVLQGFSEKKDPSTIHRSLIKEGHSWHLHNYKSQPLRGPMCNLSSVFNWLRIGWEKSFVTKSFWDFLTILEGRWNAQRGLGLLNECGTVQKTLILPPETCIKFSFSKQ